MSDTFINFGTGVALFISLGLVFLWAIGTYVANSYGLYLLAKKYEPLVEPAFSWIPILNLYVVLKLSQKSPWWILGLFVPLLNIFTLFYFYHGIAKRTGNGIGTMFLLIFFMPITLPWLGLKAHERKTTIAWVLGVCSIVAITIGYIGAIGWLLYSGLTNQGWLMYGTENYASSQQQVDLDIDTASSVTQ